MYLYVCFDHVLNLRTYVLGNVSSCFNQYGPLFLFKANTNVYFCSSNQVLHWMRCQLLAFHVICCMQLSTCIMKGKFTEISKVFFFSLTYLRIIDIKIGNSSAFLALENCFKIISCSWKFCFLFHIHCSSFEASDFGKCSLLYWVQVTVE